MKKSHIAPFGEGELCGWKTQPRVFLSFKPGVLNLRGNCGSGNNCSELLNCWCKFLPQTVRGVRQLAKDSSAHPPLFRSAGDQFFASAVAQDCSKTAPRVEIAGTAEGGAE